MLYQILNRFQGLKKVTENLNFLQPHILVNSIKESYDFIQLYINDVTSDFTHQLLSIRV